MEIDRRQIVSFFDNQDNHYAGAEMLPVSEPGGQLSFLVLLCDTLGL
jgi:hypothetical protein